MNPICVTMSPEMFERLVWVGVVVVLLVVERWLGLTSKTQASSILESIQNVIIKKALPDEPEGMKTEEKKDA